MSFSLTVLVSRTENLSGLGLPALQTLLSRGRQEYSNEALAWSERALQLAGLSPAGGMDWPLGPWSALGAGLDARQGYWFCVEPVHLLADQDQLYLAARASALAIGVDEAATLCAELNSLYAGDGWHFHAAAAERWYLHIPRPMQVQTCAPDGQEGCSLWLASPQGSEAIQLQALHNEIQMLLHGSRVNQRRRDEGKPVINSLWLWGGGEYSPLQLPWQRVVGDADLLRGFAQSGGPVHGSLEDVLSAADAGPALCVLHDADESWLLLQQALQQGKLQTIRIHFDRHAGHFVLGRSDLRRWWRRRRTLQELLGGTGS